MCKFPSSWVQNSSYRHNEHIHKNETYEIQHNRAQPAHQRIFDHVCVLLFVYSRSVHVGCLLCVLCVLCIDKNGQNMPYTEILDGMRWCANTYRIDGWHWDTNNGEYFSKSKKSLWCTMWLLKHNMKWIWRNVSRCRIKRKRTERTYRHFAHTHTWTQAQAFFICDEIRSWSASEQLQYCKETQNVTELRFFIWNIEFTVASADVIVCVYAMERTWNTYWTNRYTNRHLDNITPAHKLWANNKPFKWCFLIQFVALSRIHRTHYDVLWLGFRCCHPGEQHFGIWFKFKWQFVGAFVVTRLRPVLAI